MRYRIAWGHSGDQGKHWTTAREASRYAAEVWGHVEASTPEEAVKIVRQEIAGSIVGDWWYNGNRTIHIVGGAHE